MTDTLGRLSGYQNFQSWKREHPNDWAEVEASGKREYPLGEGPWNNEPDKVQWIDPITDLDCLVVRNHYGAWCGYVGLPPEHPWHGRHYSDCTLPERCAKSHDGYCDHDPSSAVSVHGGLTFADFCAEEEGPDVICHVAAPGRPDHVWWLGFDCGHAFDLQPGMVEFEARMGLEPLRDMIYRDLEYVTSQVTALAVQLAAASELVAEESDVRPND